MWFGPVPVLVVPIAGGPVHSAQVRYLFGQGADIADSVADHQGKTHACHNRGQDQPGNQRFDNTGGKRTH